MDNESSQAFPGGEMAYRFVFRSDSRVSSVKWPQSKFHLVIVKRITKERPFPPEKWINKYLFNMIHIVAEFGNRGTLSIFRVTRRVFPYGPVVTFVLDSMRK